MPWNGLCVKIAKTMANNANLLADALRSYQSGDLDKAENLYHQILEHDPDQVSALWGLGGIALQRKRSAEAIQWLSRAVAREPTNPMLQNNQGAAFAEAGQITTALGCYQQALREKPDFAEAFNNLANILRELGSLDQALAYYRQALLIRPNYAEAHNNLGLALWEQGREREADYHLQQACRASPGWTEARDNWNLLLQEQARRPKTEAPQAGAFLSDNPWDESPSYPLEPGPAESFPEDSLVKSLRPLIMLLRQGRLDEVVVQGREAIRLQPDFTEAYLLLGTAHVRQREFEQAEAAFRQVLRIQPNHVEACWKLGATLREQVKLERAAGYLQHALRLQPHLPEAWDHLGLSLAELGRPEEAEAAFREALGQKPDFALSLCHLGALLEEQGRLEEGLTYLQQAQDRAGPNSLPFHAHYGMSLVNQGRLEEAREHFQQTLELQPDFAPAYYMLAREGGPSVNDIMLARIGELLQRDGLTLRDRIYLHFALARIQDRRRAFAEAFDHCDRGNACKRQLLDLQGNSFQSAAHAQFIDRLMALFEANYFNRVRGYGHDNQLLIFIVGMPRSGTSLVEQILASHPVVHGAGELRNLSQLMADLPAEIASYLEYPECLSTVSPLQVHDLAELYQRGLPQRETSKQRLTDKMPMNFHHLGLVATLFPRAFIIHCQRDPRDVCWSCYFQNFRDVHFACDLQKLGAYYRQYERLMAHWRRVLPMPMLEIRYEELVQDPEQYSRQMVEFCQLPWDPVCLQFHENPRLVRTASNLQVRQPIYQRSLGYWKNYEPYLGPLLRALEGGCDS
jgi:tetratricopeptide (TPR) repeat protein